MGGLWAVGQSCKPWSHTHTLTDWDHGDDKEHVCVCRLSEKRKPQDLRGFSFTAVSALSANMSLEYKDMKILRL